MTRAIERTRTAEVVVEVVRGMHFARVPNRALANALIPLHPERHFSRSAGCEHSMLYAAREREESLGLSQARASVKTLFKFTKLNGH